MVAIHEACENLPHQYYPAIGEFMFRYAQLEYLLHEIIWRCLDIDNKQGRTLTIGAGMEVLLGTLSTITTTTGGSRWVTSSHVKGEIGNITKPAREYRALRNQLAHGSFQHPPSDKADVFMHYMKETLDQRFIPTGRRLGHAEIHNAAGKLKAAIGRAKRLIARMQADRPPQEPRQPV